MSARWFRFYDEALNDPKVQSLSGDMFKAWVNILCLASANDGKLPNARDIAFHLRASEEHTIATLEALERHGLLDAIGNQHGKSWAPHGWAKRQFKSDTSTDRVKRFRKRSETVSETPPETETDTEADKSSEPNGSASGEAQPVDYRKELFNEGLRSLARQTGKPDGKFRGLVGQWLRDNDDDARLVLTKIRQCEADDRAEPIAWLSKALAPKSKVDRRPFSEQRKDPNSVFYGVL